jgi:hypothetical protein
VRPQRDAFELPSAVRLLDLHAGGVVAVCYDHDTGVGAKVQVPELMTGGNVDDKLQIGPLQYLRGALKSSLRCGMSLQLCTNLHSAMLDAIQYGAQ